MVTKQTMTTAENPSHPAHEPWNKGKLIDQKSPLGLQEIWTIRTQLHIAHKTRDLALFNLAIDSKLRRCDLVTLRVRDVAHGDHVLSRTSIVRHKTREPVRFELTEQTREAIAAWVKEAGLVPADHLFPTRQSNAPHMSTRHYVRMLKRWVALMGADRQEYGTHSLRRTKAALIYRQTKNFSPAALRASQDRKYGEISWGRSR
jgi:integrase